MAGSAPAPGAAALSSAAASSAAISSATFVGADRGADTTAVPAAADPAGLVPVAGISSVDVARFRAAETLRVPARGVVAQVVADICGVAPKASVSRRAAVPRRARVAKPNVKVICVVPSTENKPGGKAQKPGDIQTAMSGKTIEVLNTDAEGRLILADTIHNAKQLGVTHIVAVFTPSTN